MLLTHIAVNPQMMKGNGGLVKSYYLVRVCNIMAP